MSRWQDQLERSVEAYFPAAAGGAALGLTIGYGPAFFRLAQRQGWHVDQLYTGPFTVCTVVTGLLFGFYTLVATSDRDFLVRARRSIHYKTAVRYYLHAMVLGGLATIFSLYFLVTQPAPTTRDWSLMSVAAWAALAVWSFVAAGRATWLFTLFSGHRDRD